MNNVNKWRNLTMVMNDRRVERASLNRLEEIYYVNKKQVSTHTPERTRVVQTV